MRTNTCEFHNMIAAGARVTLREFTYRMDWAQSVATVRALVPSASGGMYQVVRGNGQLSIVSRSSVVGLA
jgi:hypothetical protein